MIEGSTVKLMIIAYEDPKFTKRVGGRFGIFSSSYMLQTNPASFTKYYGTFPTQPELLANNKEKDKSAIPENKTLDISFVIDGTGAVPLFPVIVPVDVAKIKKLCLDVNGNTHTTNYLKVFWGAGLEFCCKMVSLKVEYLLFNPAGMAIRAKLDAKFKEFIDPETDASETNTNSPDMSHVITVKSGDQLTTLCNQVYGDSKYYLQVARINRITNFRSLVPGQQILFPRMEK
jgi:hypothetical protein